ncbi:MAG: magnesium/cobalt transporter CorA [Bacteroidales bacterium]
MARFIKDRKASAGTSPGSLILIGNQKMGTPEIQLMEIRSEELVEKELESLEDVHFNGEKEKVTWINIWGIHEISHIQTLGEKLDLHPLFMEDLLNTDQRPSFVDGDGYMAFILKMLSYDEDSGKLASEQITLILGKGFVVTLQEQKGDVLDPVRQRIRNITKRVRFTDADYLAYALFDTLVDQYIVLTETLGRKIEAMDERLFGDPDPDIIQDIYLLKTELSFLRKSVRPVKEMMTQVLVSESPFLKRKYIQYFRDLNDLVNQATEAIELYSGMISDHLNIYSTNLNNRTNEVMKVLTIFASIFIPLTFLAGIYGMNFTHMPELDFRYSYPLFWVVVLCVGVGLWIFFRRRIWF